MINASKFPKTAFHDYQTIRQSADEVSCRARTELPRYFIEAPKPQAIAIERHSQHWFPRSPAPEGKRLSGVVDTYCMSEITECKGIDFFNSE